MYSSGKTKNCLTRWIQYLSIHLQFCNYNFKWFSDYHSL